MTKRICLWSGPRNISTALMYSFAQRSDTSVYDEPLYAHYLNHTDASEYHPGAEDILGSMEKDGGKVIEMMMGEHSKPVVFFKHMTHHLLDMDRSFLKEVINIILIRDPAEMLHSFAKVIDNPSMKDLGYTTQIDLVTHLQETNINPIIIDSKKLLLDPQNVLQQLCTLLGIPFEEKMLHWRAGARPEDGVWAKYWYSSIHESVGFIEYKAKTEPFPDNLKPLLESCLPHYNQLLKLSI
jgi:hypothetical protein